MSEVIETTVNAGQGNAVDSQNVQVTETNNSVPTDKTEQVKTVNADDSGVTTQKPEQDKDTNAAFAEMRRKNERLEKDLSIAQKYGKDYGIFSEADIAKQFGESHGITTLEQFETALEAQNKNVDPELYAEVKEMKSKLSKYEAMERMTEQEKSLSSDPVKGQLYNQWKNEIKELAESFQGDLKGNLFVAFTLMCEKKLPEILKTQEIKAKNEHNAQTSTGSVTGQGDVPSDFISKDVFEKNKGNQKWMSQNYDLLLKSMNKW